MKRKKSDQIKDFQHKLAKKSMKIILQKSVMSVKKHDMPLSQRTMKCDCGNVIDRDRNSAINIMEFFLL